MSALIGPPPAYNEPVKGYLPGSPERASLRRTLDRMAAERVEIASVIDGKEVRTGKVATSVMPHLHSHVLGDIHLAGASEVGRAIEAALGVRRAWAATAWPERAAVFLRAADLLTGPWRDVLNAATMLGQSKTVHQAEIDAVCELADFLRFNVEYMTRIYAEQPLSPPGFWNRMEYRPLEGFVFAVSPFNFTSIAGNLPTAAALMGNTVVWKAAETAAFSAHYLMQLFQAAGLPDGVINLVHAPGSVVGQTVLDHPDLAGIHFTGSTEVFRWMWKRVGDNLERYRVYPRLVGETGGKDFIVAHPSADCSMTAPMKLPKSRTSPIRMLDTSSAIRPLTSRHMGAGTKTREGAEHFWPWYSKPPRTTAVTSSSTSALGWATMKSLPPVSPTRRG